MPLTACLNITQPYAENIIYPNFARYIDGDTMPSGLPTSAPSITAASFVPQGTLAGMGSLMNTFPAGGPQSPSATYSLSFSSASGSGGKSASTGNGKADTTKSSTTSGADMVSWKAPMAFISTVLVSILLSLCL